MFRMLLGALALVSFAETASASVYRYDISMALNNLELRNGYFTGTGEIPDWLGGASCSGGVPGDPYFMCEEDVLDLKDDRLGVTAFERFDAMLMATLFLDSDFGYSGGQPPVCEGAVFLCDGIDAGYDLDFGYSATSDGFSLYLGNLYLIKDVSSTGIEYEDDGAYFATVGNTYIHGANFIRASYDTTSLEIRAMAPVPLPAGLLLLPSALMLLGLRRRARS